jgi:hypothetical protein
MRLLVRPWYGEDMNRPAAVDNYSFTYFEKAVLAVFEHFGYEIYRTDSLSSYRTGDFSILGESDSLDISDLLKSPKAYRPTDILATEEPIVVKLRYAHNGHGKFLLETLDQKRLFLSYMMFNKVPQDHDEVITERDHNLKLLHEEDFTKLNNREASAWSFEEYVKTCSEFNTSYRILLGADGNLFYSELLRSSNQKSKNLLAMPIHPERSNNFFDEIILSRHNLFTEEESPFYLGSKDILSNYRGGRGVSIMLDGKKKSDRSDRECLIAHGIDPDRPTLPEPLIVASKVIGPRYAQTFPVVGLDVFQNKQDGFFKGEVNDLACIDPLSMNLPEEFGIFGTYLYLFCQVAKINLDHEDIMQIMDMM